MVIGNWQHLCRIQKKKKKVFLQNSPKFATQQTLQNSKSDPLRQQE